MMMLANIVGRGKKDNRLSELKALTYMFVSAINSIQFDFQKKRFSINLKEIKLGNINLSKLI